MKSIIIINQYIGSPYHGMEYRHYYLARNLIKLGYKVTLITGSYSHLFTTLPKTNSQFTKEYIDGIEYIWVRLPKYKTSKSIGRIWNMMCFAWKLRFLKDLEPSHIIVSSPSLFPVKIAYEWTQKFKTKLLFEIRDIWPLTLTEFTSLTYRHPLIRIMYHYEKFGYRHADKIISLLPNAKKYYIDQGMKEDKFVYVPNGIEVDERTKDELPDEVRKKIPKNKFIIAYIGTVGLANNLDYLIDGANALKKYHDIHFIVLGNGGEKNRLEKRVKTLLLSNVSFIDAIDKDKVENFLSYVDVAFISLVSENLFKFGVSPNKVFDYMYAKKPIIWAIAAGNDLVKEAQCGESVLLNNIEYLKDSVLKLYAMSETERCKLGENGYNFVLQNNSYQALAKKVIRIIEEQDV